MKRMFPLLALAILFFSFGAQAQQAPSATEILKEATAEAAKKKKEVFVIFHASWCGWCHKMDTILQSPAVKPVFDKYFITRHMTVLESEQNKKLETPGGKEFMDEYHGGNSGIPYWLVFDGGGKLLADARIRKEPGGAPGGNSGCPATKEEIEYFVSVLKNTSKMSAEEAEVIAKEFRKIRGL